MDKSVLRYLSLVFFWFGNFDAWYFFGSKISGLCIFLGLQYEAPSDSPVMNTSSTPPPPPPWDIEDVMCYVLYIKLGCYERSPRSTGQV